MLIIFFNGGGLSCDQWFNHPYEDGLKTDFVYQFKQICSTYLYDPIFYLEPSLIEKFRTEKRKCVFTIRDVDIKQHCKDLYDKVSILSDKYILISHSRGFMFATVFAQLYKDRVCGFLNIDGGYSSQKYEAYIEILKSQLPEKIDDILLEKISVSIRNNDDQCTQNIKILKDIGKLLCFSQHKDVDMMKLQVPTIILNNIEHNSEINLDMNDYVADTLKDKIEFNERLSANKFIESRYFVNKTHFMYFGMEEYIINIVKDFIKKCNNGVKQIYLIRHGETDANKNNISQGAELDLSLNNTGIDQAEKTGHYLKRHITDNECIILSSPQLRAEETADIINQHINVEVKRIKELSEISKGRMSGLEVSDPLIVKIINIQKDFFNKYNDPIERGKMGCEGFNNFMEDRTKDDDIGFELIKTLKHRINKIINFIKASDFKKIILVSHSGFLELLLKTMINIFDSDVDILVKGNMKNGKNCWISRLDYDPVSDVFRMITAPNTEHLKLI